MQKVRCAVLVGLLLLLAGSQQMLAYDNDTHYVLTYYLARRVGFTPIQAHQIASADVSVDVEPNTEPLQMSEIANPMGSAQIARAGLHALPETADQLSFALTHFNRGELKSPGFDAEKYRKEVEEGKRRLRNLGWVAGNPGVYLHYMQDSYAHAGYLSFSGHMLPGHVEDYLSRRPETSAEMVAATITALSDFMRDHLHQIPCVPDKAEVGDVLKDLIAANPAPAIADYPEDNKLLRILPTFWAEPDWHKAVHIVEKVLHENVPPWTAYHYDTGGNWMVSGRPGSPPNPISSAAHAIGIKPDEYPPQGNRFAVIEDPLGMLTGSWRSPNLQSIIINYKPEENEGEHYHVELSGAHEWKGSYMPEKKQWVFFRDVSDVELPADKAPEWARQGAASKIKWRMFLNTECPCKLKGEWYPGVFHWEEVKEGGTANVLSHKVSVQQGKAGWGTARPVEWASHGPVMSK